MKARVWRERGVGLQWVPPTDRGRELFTRYQLSKLTDYFSRESWDEILGTLDLLDRVPRDLIPGPTVLDVGSKNWAYLPAISVWLESRRRGQLTAVTGVEIAGRRRYWDLSTRESRARWYQEHASLGGVIQSEYLSGDFREVRGRYALMTWFFPFLSIESHQSWGLSSRLFDPSGLFQKASAALTEEGLLILSNHGDWEWEQSCRLLHARSFQASFSQRIEGSLHASQYPIWLSGWRPKPGAHP